MRATVYDVAFKVHSQGVVGAALAVARRGPVGLDTASFATLGTCDVQAMHTDLCATIGTSCMSSQPALE